MSTRFRVFSCLVPAAFTDSNSYKVMRWQESKRLARLQGSLKLSSNSTQFTRNTSPIIGFVLPVPVAILKISWCFESSFWVLGLQLKTQGSERKRCSDSVAVAGHCKVKCYLLRVHVTRSFTNEEIRPNPASAPTQQLINQILTGIRRFPFAFRFAWLRLSLQFRIILSVSANISHYDKL